MSADYGKCFWVYPRRTVCQERQRNNPQRGSNGGVWGGMPVSSGLPAGDGGFINRSFSEVNLFVIWARLWAERRNIKKTSLPKSIKISKNATSDAQGFNFHDLLMPFEPLFSINFPDPLNLSNCKNYNAETSFFTITDLQFWYQNHPNNHVFSNPFLGNHFVHLMLFFAKTAHFGDPFKIQWAQKSPDTGRYQALSDKRM